MWSRFTFQYVCMISFVFKKTIDTGTCFTLLKWTLNIDLLSVGYLCIHHKPASRRWEGMCGCLLYIVLCVWKDANCAHDKTQCCMLLLTTRHQFISHLSTDALHPYGGRVVIGGSLNCKRNQLELALLHVLLPHVMCAWKVTHGSEPGYTYQVRVDDIESGVQSKMARSSCVIVRCWLYRQ